MSDPWAEFRVPQNEGAPQAAAPDPWSEFRVPAEKPGMVEDVVKSAGSGLAEGAAGMVGLPGTLSGLADDLIGQTVGRARNYLNTGEWKADNGKDVRVRREKLRAEAPLPSLPAVDEILTSENATAAIESVTGPLYKPQTTAGEYANTVAEFAPGALMGAGTAAQRAAQVVVPAVASEGAGQAARQIAPEMEPMARAVGAVGGGLATALKQAPKASSQVASEHMTHLADDDLLKAGRLMEDAQARGVQLTWPEAIAQTTGDASSLTTLQRFVEGSEQGGEVMRGVMSKRPAQIEAAGRGALDDIAPPVANPTGLGPAAAEAAQGVIDDGAAIINKATRPLYQAAEAQRIDADAFGAIAKDPVFAEGLKAVRSDRFIGPTLADLPDDSVAVVDAVKKWADETSGNLRNPTNPTSSKYAAGIVEKGRDRAVAAADEATGSTPEAMGSYEAARAAQREAREKYLKPLMDGPLGRIAERKETKGAMDALFPTNPLPGSAEEVGTAVSALVQKRPKVAESLVRAHAESVFNETTQKVSKGGNEFGGAKFAAVLAGNPQQRANLQAAVEALPSGKEKWTGFERMLEVFEATGKRQAAGSPTASNQQIRETMEQGGKAGESANLIAGGLTKLPEFARERFKKYRLNKASTELANLFTDPKALPLLRELAGTKASSRKAHLLTLRLMYFSERSVNSDKGPK